jgi:hypothetical protein
VLFRSATPEAAQTYTQMGFESAQGAYEQKRQTSQTAIINNQKALNLLEGDTAQDWKTRKFLKENDVVDGDVITVRQNIKTEFENEEQAKQEYQDQLADVLNKGTEAALSSVENGDNRLSALLGQYMQLGFLDADPAEIVGKLKTDAVNSVLGSAYTPGEMDTGNANGLNTWLTASEEAINQLKSNIAGEMETGDFNPVAEMLKNAMDGVDLSGVDTGKLSDAVKGLLALIDFDDTDGDVSKDIWQGLANGLSANYGIAEDEMKQSAESLIASVKAVLGIQSPSTVMKGIGGYLMEGLRDGIQLNAGIAMAPLQTLTDTDLPRLGTDMMNALIRAMDRRAEALKTTMRNSVRNAMTATQLIANQGIKIPVTMTYASTSTKKFSQQLGL